MDIEVDNLSETEKPLGEVVHHSELFKNYPRIKEMKIELAELSQGVDGETLTSGKIRINKNVTDTNKIKKILIHEIQHLIQQEEGFASGANVEYWKNKGDVAAQQRAVRRLEKQENRYEEMYKKWSAKFKAMADKMLNNEEWVEGRNKEEYERIEQIAAEKYPDEYDEYFDISWDLLTAHNAVKNSGETSLYTAYDNYWNTAGEQEARDVEKRLNYTAEQRQDVRPFVGNDDTVFVGKGIKSEHISDTAEQEIDKALANKNYRQEIKLRDFTPKILVEHGVKDLPMVMNASHLRENIFTEEEAAAKGLKINSSINYHGLGKDLFMQVIDSLDNPQRVYRDTKNADNSSRGENYFLIISTLKDKDGNFINVTVYIVREGFHNNVVIDTNKIATVFGRTNINKYIDKQIKHGNLVKINRSSNKSNRPSPINGVKDVTTSKNNVPQSSQNSNSKKHAEVGKNDIRFSLNNAPKDDFESQFKRYKDGKFKQGDFFIVGNTPDMFQKEKACTMFLQMIILL